MITKFEEKTYENYFNAELDRRSSVFFPLGQVQEGFLGFDSSANSRNRNLWRRLGHPFWFYPPFGGIELREMAREMEHYLEDMIRGLPKMKANLLFQYKRPEFIKSSLGKEWPHWNEPYYRYDIYNKQQILLNEIDLKFRNKVLIVYASPTARNINELVNQKLSGDIINLSNFTKARDLNGHHRNTYISSGTFSIACSKAEKIEKLDLISALENITEEETDNNLSNKQFIINFRRQISAIVSDNEFYGQSFVKLKDELTNYGKSELLHSFIVLSIFKQITGIQWLVKT